MHRHNLSVEEICSILFELMLPHLLTGGIKCAVLPLSSSSNLGITTYITLSVIHIFFLCVALADLGWRARRTPSPMGPNFSFSHTFSPKSICTGGPRPLTGARRPMGNPGSATVLELHIPTYLRIFLSVNYLACLYNFAESRACLINSTACTRFSQMMI